MNARAIRAISAETAVPCGPRCGPGDLAKCDNAPSYTGKGVRATEGQARGSSSGPGGHRDAGRGEVRRSAARWLRGRDAPGRTDRACTGAASAARDPSASVAGHGGRHLARTGRRAGSRTTTRRTLGAEAEEPFEPPPLDLEPPLRYEPLVPVAIPPPTWREDEDRLRAAEAQEKLEASRDPYPARPASEKAPRWP